MHTFYHLVLSAVVHAGRVSTEESLPGRPYLGYWFLHNLAPRYEYMHKNKPTSRHPFRAAATDFGKATGFCVQVGGTVDVLLHGADMPEVIVVCGQAI